MISQSKVLSQILNGDDVNSMNPSRYFHIFRGYSMSFGSVLIKIGMSFCVFFITFGIVSAAQVTPSDAVTNSVNVRSSPSARSQIVTKLFPGERADLMDVVGDWYEIQLPNGMRGFVSTAWTIRVDESVDTVRTAEDTTVDVPVDISGSVTEPIVIEHYSILSDSVTKLRDDIDSLTEYIHDLSIEYKKHAPSKKTTLLFIFSIFALAVAVFLTVVTKRISPGKEKSGKEERETKAMSRKAYFAVTSPRIEQTQNAFYNLCVSFINTGDNPAISLQARIYMIDTYVTNAEIFREFTFSTANPIASHNDLTFCEENIDFTDECTPKFVCIAIEYVDQVLRKRFQQEFTYMWGGIKKGQVQEECSHVDKEKSELVWLKVRELRYVKEKESRNSQGMLGSRH